MKRIMNIKHMNRVLFLFNKSNIVLVLAFLSFSGSLSAETIRGVIREAGTKQPVNAARIQVINKDVSVVSDEKGRFFLENVNQGDVLSVEAYDFGTREVSIRERDSMTIDLYSDVFTNYYKYITDLSKMAGQSKQTASIKSLDEVSRSSAITIDELFQSELGADVRSIARSGVTGMGSSLFIRGLNSINANAQPLFVVDGVIWDNQYDVVSVQKGFFSNVLDNIDVNDIQSVTVLKDGTSIYGSKASNGVILIKTKRSRSQVTKIALNVSMGYTNTPGNIPMMNGEDYRVYVTDLLGSAGVQGSALQNLDYLQTNPANPVFNTYHNTTDWSKETYQVGQNNSYMISAMGGDEKAHYYFSVGLTENKGVVKATDLLRLNTRFNADIRLVEKADLGMNIGFTQTQRTLLDDGVNDYSSPTWLARIKSPIFSPHSFTNSGDIMADYADADFFDIGNPSAVIRNSLNSLKKFRFNIGIRPEYRITPELTISSQFDYSLLQSNERRFVPMKGTSPRYLEKYKEYSQNEINSQVIRNTTLFDDTRLNYKKDIGDDHHLNALYGWRYITNYFESDYVEEHNTGSDNNTTITGAYDFLKVDGFNNHTKSISNYFQAEYDFNNRYFATAAMSFDASSRFGAETIGGLSMFGRSWGVFPSINTAWLVSSEPFMKSIGFINFLKLRLGYGLTGNDGIKDYDAMTYFAYIHYMDRANGLILGNLANKELQWETTARANLGLDMGLFNERLQVTFDFYSGITDNLLVLREAPVVTGLGSYWSNSGTLTNRGYELSAQLKALNLKHLKWEFGFNLGQYKNNVTALPDGDFKTTAYGGEVLTAVGHPVNSFFGYKTKGIFSTVEEASTAYTNPFTGVQSSYKIINEDGSFASFGAGDVQFDDYNNDGIIDKEDKQVIGDPNPDFYGSMTSKISVDKLTLSAVLTYSLGNDVYNYSRSRLESGTNFNNQTTIMLHRWTGDGQETVQPKAFYGDPMSNARFSDRWIEDGSYLRLKHVSLSYRVPIKSIYIEGVEVWVSASNLWTMTKYLGLDPEFSSSNSVLFQGIDAGLVPLTQSFQIGFKLNL